MDFLDAIQKAYGAKGMDRLIAARAKQQCAAFLERIPKRGSLQRRIEVLAEIRTEEGYMADVEEQDDGSYLLVENHCPICIAATACVGLCGAELELFEKVFGGGDKVHIERTEHIICGARRCAYRISRN